MPAPVNPNIKATFAPPVMEARRWLDGVTFSRDRPLINVSQAAPTEPPHEALRAEMARLVQEVPEAHLYGAVLGLPELRAELAATTNRIYGAAASSEQVAITAGCNQAFTATLATLAAPGDEIILPTPWYFNHKMAADMAGITAVPLPTGKDLLPDPAAAEALITSRTRAIALVTPNNPSGAEYPAALLAAFRDLARSRGIALLVDETYRDFHASDGAPHALLADPDWDDTVVQLYSFSKAYRLTGHRVGAVLTSPARMAQIEKYLDTVTICPPQLGQMSALWGLRNLGTWLEGERQEILSRRGAMVAAMADVPGWKMLGCGAYFAYVQHPFAEPSDHVARHLVRDAGVLALPGTMFKPGSDPSGAQEMRIAFANIDADGIASFAQRLREVDGLSLAAPAALP